MSTLNYQITGSGTTVILIHGLFGDLDNLKALGNSLSEHQVIRVDLPNHGKSPHWDAMDYPSLAQAMVNLLDQLNIKQAHFVGHSMGGKVAMAVALLHPSYVKSLVVADIAPVTYHRRHDTVFNGLNSLDVAHLSGRSEALGQLVASGIDEGTAQFLLKNLQREATGFSWKMNLNGLQACYEKLIGWELNSQQTLNYSGPALCIRGADSDYVTAAHSQAFIQQFPAIQAKSLAGTGHWLHVQKPAIFNRLIAEFIDSND
ncbi:alpha/beta fold hydrolase [Shewanella sp. Isolate11]|uniref:alpha/beta fold hydrolase n=1 Tax=Shewanella sp. Isolate11 TaxID=2908530 RepID=UPI001EFDB2B2|nr:alpha/beta fold hydrolase [Shewanella sp. Isolate11]MCG9696739.1 alpha/beta fold hydrolase [Shewanella sp. Isolate11]